jgi:hypothetical protein
VDVLFEVLRKYKGALFSRKKHLFFTVLDLKILVQTLSGLQYPVSQDGMLVSIARSEGQNLIQKLKL